MEIMFYNRRLLYEMAMRLQCAWRGRTGRMDYNFAARRKAFYEALRMALAETRAKIEAKFAKRDEAKGVARMKWKAEVEDEAGCDESQRS